MPLLTPAPPVYYIKWVICPPLFNTTVVLLNFATTMISACGCFLEPLLYWNRNARVLPMKGKILQKKEAYRPFCVKLWAKPESKLWLALCVYPCKFCKTEKCMSHLYRCVLYTSHCFPPEHGHVKRIMVFVSLLVSLYVLFLCGMFFVNLSYQSPERGKYFLLGTCILWEFIFWPPKSWHGR